MNRNFLSSYQQDNLQPITDWDALDDFWANLSDISGQGWYLYTVSELPPESPAGEDDVQEFIVHIDTLLRKEHTGDQCPCVFTDDRETPSFVKILDPLKLASLSHDHHEEIPARWTLSLCKPVELRGMTNTKNRPKPELSLVNSPPEIPETSAPLDVFSEQPSVVSEPEPNLSTTADPLVTLPELSADCPIDTQVSMEDSLELSSEFDVGYESITEPEPEDDIIDDKTEQNQVELIPALDLESNEPGNRPISMYNPKPENQNPEENTDGSAYKLAYRGRLVAINQWEDLDEFWNVMHSIADESWYIYAIGERPPKDPAPTEKVHEFILEIDTLLRKDHDEEYCKIVYADDHKHPSFVKIYDPNNLGVVCGSSDNPPLPGWTLSKQQPINLEAAFPPPGNRRRWWQKMFAT